MKKIVLWLFFSLSPAALAAEELVNCMPIDTAIDGGDNLNRGFFIEEYPGHTLDKVYLWFTVSSPGEGSYRLTARSNTFDGAVLGTAEVSHHFSNTEVNVPLIFDFRRAPVSLGQRVAFEIDQISGPSSFYAVVHSDSCSVTQTNDTSPPLSSERRDGITVLVEGLASAPTATTGSLENPPDGANVSGIGLISGWACDAERIEAEIDGVIEEVAYGTARNDTSDVCGDSDNGFGLLVNWNLLGDGAHTIRLLADDLEVDSATFTVTTLGEEFSSGLSGSFNLQDFPQDGEQVSIEWQEAFQNFVITDFMP